MLTRLEFPEDDSCMSGLGGIMSLKLRASPTKATMATPFAQN